jgi:hypothetical protein
VLAKSISRAILGLSNSISEQQQRVPYFEPILNHCVPGILEETYSETLAAK